MKHEDLADQCKVFFVGGYDWFYVGYDRVVWDVIGWRRL